MPQGVAPRRFTDAHAGKTHTRGQSAHHFVGDMLGDEFGGGIYFLKGRHFIQRAIMKRRDRVIHRRFKGMKVAEQTVGIQLVAADADLHTPIVTMHRLHLPRHANGVGGRELSAHFKFKHGSQSIAIAAIY